MAVVVNCARSVYGLLLAAILLAAQDTTGVGSLSGIVTDEASSSVADAVVCLGGIERCTTTDSSGRFHLDQLRAATYPLRIERGSGASALAAGQAEVRAGLDVQVQLVIPALEPVRQTVTVTAGPLTPPEEIKNSAHLLDGMQIFKSAGTFQDVSRFVQALPGTAIGSDDFRNDIIVRGGSPLENLFIVDNVEIPNINTFANFASAGGTVSILDPNMIRDVTFLTGGYPAPYGNRTSSVLQISQRDGDHEKLRGRLNLLFGGGGGLIEGPLGGGKGSWAISARRSFLDLFTSDTGIGGVPVLYTVNAKATYDVTAKDRVWIVNLTGIDNIRLGLTESNRNDTDGELNNYDIRYSGRRTATGLNWQHLFSTSAVGLLGLSHSRAGVESSVRDLVRNGVPPIGVPVSDIIAGSPLVFREDSREGESTAKYDLTVDFPGVSRLQAGGSFKVFQIRYDTASPLGNDTPYSPTPGLSPFFLDRSFRPTQSGSYVQATQTVFGRLNLTAGARFDHYSFLGRSRFSPRTGISFRITDRVIWSGSYGQYYQQPFYLFLAAFDENRGAIPFRADHFVTGVRYTPMPGLRLGVEAYRKNYKDYPVARDLPQLSLANLGDTFNVREILLPLTSAGRGRSQGVEFSIEKVGSGKWFGQMNFAVLSTRQAGLDGILRPSSFDYPRVFNLIGGYRLSRKWELATRISYLSGRPYTPFDVRLSTEQRRGVYDLSQVNGLRLPDYFRLDIRADRTFYVKNQPVLLFLGVQNVTNRRNTASYQWNRRTGAIDLNEQLGIFPLAGFEWRF